MQRACPLLESLSQHGQVAWLSLSERAPRV